MVKRDTLEDIIWRHSAQYESRRRKGRLKQELRQRIRRQIQAARAQQDTAQREHDEKLLSQVGELVNALLANSKPVNEFDAMLVSVTPGDKGARWETVPSGIVYETSLYNPPPIFDPATIPHFTGINPFETYTQIERWIFYRWFVEPESGKPFRVLLKES